MNGLKMKRYTMLVGGTLLLTWAAVARAVPMPVGPPVRIGEGMALDRRTIPCGIQGMEQSFLIECHTEAGLQRKPWFAQVGRDGVPSALSPYDFPVSPADQALVPDISSEDILAAQNGPSASQSTYVPGTGKIALNYHIPRTYVDGLILYLPSRWVIFDEATGRPEQAVVYDAQGGEFYGLSLFDSGVGGNLSPPVRLGRYDTNGNFVMDYPVPETSGFVHHNWFFDGSFLAQGNPMNLDGTSAGSSPLDDIHAAKNITYDRDKYVKFSGDPPLVQRYEFPVTPIGTATATQFVEFDYYAAYRTAANGRGQLLQGGPLYSSGVVPLTFVDTLTATETFYTLPLPNGEQQCDNDGNVVGSGDGSFAILYTCFDDPIGGVFDYRIYLEVLVHQECGNGLFESAIGEECDDGNLNELDGCASDCTDQICGDSVLDTGEECDDGNRTSGDGCDLICQLEESVDQIVAPGGTASSDGGEGDGATGDDPVETSVTSPNGGNVTIVETAHNGTGDNSGFTGAGRQVLISAPAASVADPLVIVFDLDAAAIPSGESLSTMQLYRNGARVNGCTGAPQAIPDPCISSAMVHGPGPLEGDIRVTVLTSAASSWGFGTSCGDGNVNAGESCDDSNTTSGDGCSAACQIEDTQNEAQVACLVSHLKTAVKVGQTQLKRNGSCLKDASNGKEADASACIISDPKGKLHKSRAKVYSNYVKKCIGSTPDFARPTNLRSLPVASLRNLVFDLIANPTAEVVNAADDEAGAKCQQGVQTTAAKYVALALGEFGKCVASLGKEGQLTSADQLQGCLFADPAGKHAKAAAKVQSARETTCAGIDLSATMTGVCSDLTGPAFDACVVRLARCRACQAASDTVDVGFACDAADDGLLNLTCLDPS